jgi:hypothetical protein
MHGARRASIAAALLDHPTPPQPPGTQVVEQLAGYGVKLVAMRCAGYDKVDLAACERAGIRVVRVPTYGPVSVAEHAVALMFNLSKCARLPGSPRMHGAARRATLLRAAAPRCRAQERAPRAPPPPPPWRCRRRLQAPAPGARARLPGQLLAGRAGGAHDVRQDCGRGGHRRHRRPGLPHPQGGLGWGRGAGRPGGAGGC